MYFSVDADDFAGTDDQKIPTLVTETTDQIQLQQNDCYTASNGHKKKSEMDE